MVGTMLGVGGWPTRFHDWSSSGGRYIRTLVAALPNRSHYEKSLCGVMVRLCNEPVIPLAKVIPEGL